MRTLMLALAFVLTLTSGGIAQTGSPTAVPTQRQQSGPFSSDWAKPYPETGGYIYNDPRYNQNRRSGTPSTAPHPACPLGTVFIPSTGRCG
jgi:hypothetical protein